MHVQLHMGEESPTEIPVTDFGAAKVRYKFNPSGLARVQRIKFLAAALISEIEDMNEEGESDIRESAIAITDIQKGTMMAVASATSKL